eukprot:TRINITY_DN24789_c0_g1_i2.p1 TRINITY_DN24789_c0_g1~~TRINITY_DN24789_c0_g1_i2.p1  ORF type:complete len:652 (+),score=70.73 TRINITY_DN24789_c0_g1_i2:155-1957(+)
MQRADLERQIGERAQRRERDVMQRRMHDQRWLAQGGLGGGFGGQQRRGGGPSQFAYGLHRHGGQPAYGGGGAGGALVPVGGVGLASAAVVMSDVAQERELTQLRGMFSSDSLAGALADAKARKDTAPAAGGILSSAALRLADGASVDDVLCSFAATAPLRRAAGQPPPAPPLPLRPQGGIAFPAALQRPEVAPRGLFVANEPVCNPLALPLRRVAAANDAHLFGPVLPGAAAVRSASAPLPPNHAQLNTEADGGTAAALSRAASAAAPPAPCGGPGALGQALSELFQGRPLMAAESFGDGERDAERSSRPRRHPPLPGRAPAGAGGGSPASPGSSASSAEIQGALAELPGSAQFLQGAVLRSPPSAPAADAAPALGLRAPVPSQAPPPPAASPCYAPAGERSSAAAGPAAATASLRPAPPQATLSMTGGPAAVPAWLLGAPGGLQSTRGHSAAEGLSPQRSLSGGTPPVLMLGGSIFEIFIDDDVRSGGSTLVLSVRGDGELSEQAPAALVRSMRGSVGTPTAFDALRGAIFPEAAWMRRDQNTYACRLQRAPDYRIEQDELVTFTPPCGLVLSALGDAVLSPAAPQSFLVRCTDTGNFL